MPNVHRYRTTKGWRWRIDAWLKTPTGRERLREQDIPTKEQAEARLAKARSDAYQGRAFQLEQAETLTVAEAWKLYAPVDERDCDSWKSDRSRAAHLQRHIGAKRCAALSQADVDGYRTLRLAEKTRRDKPPSPATLDREVELLKRVLGYAVRCAKLKTNPLAGVAMLRVPNVVGQAVTEDAFESLIDALERRSQWMRAPLLLAFDTGMRIGEVMQLQRDRVDWRDGTIRLKPQETKSEQARIVVLQRRTLEALRSIPHVLGSPFLFANPRTKQARGLPRRGFKKALKAAGLSVTVRVHDLRVSFATLTRRQGIPESVVMRMGGWRTASMFRRYNIVDEADLREAARMIEDGREKSSQDGQRTASGPKTGNDGSEKTK